jgi:hypothetical protein
MLPAHEQLMIVNDDARAQTPGSPDFTNCTLGRVCGAAQPTNTQYRRSRPKMAGPRHRQRGPAVGNRIAATSLLRELDRFRSNVDPKQASQIVPCQIQVVGSHAGTDLQNVIQAAPASKRANAEMYGSSIYRRRNRPGIDLSAGLASSHTCSACHPVAVT